MIIPLKNCEECGKLMQRRVFPAGAVEGPTMYRKRRWCSLQCSNVGLRQRPLTERFWEKVEKTATCWLWRGAVGRDGYGHIHVNREHHAIGAHRVSWFLHTNVWPTLDVLHRCDVRICVRHDHHYLGTDLDNCADKKARGRVYQPPRGADNPRSKLSWSDRAQLKALFEEGASISELARQFSAGRTTIHRIVGSR